MLSKIKQDKTVAIQVRITKQQKDELDMILSKTGVTQSNLIRLFLNEYINKHKYLLNNDSK
jgi:antitoxin component of RelBE/YafQ-DinJ toxin-antitoxin module